MPTMNDKIGGKDQLDLGLCISAPTKDPEWFKKCVLMGLMMLIPIAGALNLSGWMRTYADRRIKNGEDRDRLPDANLDYIGAGWRMFLAYLPLVGLLFAMLFVCGLLAGVAGYLGSRDHHHGGDAPEAIVMIIIGLMYLGIIAFALVMSVISPAITFLHVVEDEPWAGAQFRRIWETMRAGGTQYLLLFLAALIAGAIGQLGMLACYVGMFVSIPFGQAIMGASIAEYARLTKPVDPSFPVEGGTGGASGDPFGVKL